MPYTMEDLKRDYLIDALSELLQEKTAREQLMPIIMMNWPRDSPNEQIQAQLQRVDSLTQTRETFMRAIGYSLQIRFQTNLDLYRSRLETLPLTELQALDKLAETAQTLADFEAHLP